MEEKSKMSKQFSSPNLRGGSAYKYYKERNTEERNNQSRIIRELRQKRDRVVQPEG